MNIFISSFFHIICTLYTYTKLLPYHSKQQKLVHPIPLCTLYIVTVLCQFYCPFWVTLIFTILFSLYTTIYFGTKYDLSIITTIISYAFFRIGSYISSLVLTIFCIPLYFKNKTMPNTYSIFIIGILCFVFQILIFKIKRLRAGMPFLYKSSFISIGLIISFVITLIKTIDQILTHKEKYSSNILLGALLPFATLLLALLLFTWWRKQITKSYIEKLRKLEIQSLYDELAEKEEQIKKLTKDNDSLASIIHTDNKLIPAMEHAVTEFLSNTDFHDPDAFKQYGKDLTERLREMTHDRQGILDSYEYTDKKLKLTGLVSVDAMLVFMQQKEEAKHIVFECKHTPETLNYLLTKISEKDLSLLLSDLLENAIISMRGMDAGRLQITFGKLQNEAYISVADTGCDFELDTLHSFGIKQHTTHENTGGSGRGLIAIWDYKKKYRATIQIQEYEKNTNAFTKRIFFSFNSKNHYVIQSFRHAEIKNTQTRGDLYIIPMETKTVKEETKDERNT